MSAPRILSIGTAVPPSRYTQRELADLFKLSNPRIVGLFERSHIRHRHLTLPQPGPLGMPDESVEELLEKHRKGCLQEGALSLRRGLEEAGLQPADLDYLVCVTSTGFLCPGVSALLIQQEGLREDIHRIDVVGMGCNAAVNGLQPLVRYLEANPRARGAMVCVENCSAAYVLNDTVVTAVVNSLFGDASATVVMAGAEAEQGGSLPYPRVEAFDSHTAVDYIHTMRFDLEKGKLSFYLDRDIPYAIGANCAKPVGRLLARAGLKKRHVSHWVIHSGGKKVIDSVKMNLELSDHDLRHTVYVLENYGNISSCSVLFTLRLLAEEGVTKPDDYGLLMAMGPGAAIETALLHW